MLESAVKDDPHSLLVEEQISTAIMKISMKVSQSIKNGNIIWPHNTAPGNTPKVVHILSQSTCTSMYIANIFIIARKEIEPDYMSINKSINNEM